jgi:hypothetical protein
MGKPPSEARGGEQNLKGMLGRPRAQGLWGMSAGICVCVCVRPSGRAAALKAVLVCVRRHVCDGV